MPSESKVQEEAKGPEEPSPRESLNHAENLVSLDQATAALAVARPLLLHVDTRTEALKLSARCFEATRRYSRARYFLQQLVAECPTEVHELASFDSRVLSGFKNGGYYLSRISLGLLAIVVGLCVGLAGLPGNPISEFLWLVADIRMSDPSIGLLLVGGAAVVVGSVLFLANITKYLLQQTKVCLRRKLYRPLLRRTCQACRLVTRHFARCEFCHTPWLRPATGGRSSIPLRTVKPKLIAALIMSVVCVIAVSVSATLRQKVSSSSTSQSSLQEEVAPGGPAAPEGKSAETSDAANPKVHAPPEMIVAQESAYWDLVSKLKSTSAAVYTGVRHIPTDWPEVEKAYLNQVANHKVTIREVRKVTEIQLKHPTNPMRFFTDELAVLTFLVEQRHNEKPANWACYFVYFGKGGKGYRTTMKQLAAGKLASDLKTLEASIYPVLPDYEPAASKSLSSRSKVADEPSKATKVPPEIVGTYHLYYIDQWNGGRPRRQPNEMKLKILADGTIQELSDPPAHGNDVVAVARDVRVLGGNAIKNWVELSAEATIEPPNGGGSVLRSKKGEQTPLRISFEYFGGSDWTGVWKVERNEAGWESRWYQRTGELPFGKLSGGN